MRLVEDQRNPDSLGCLFMEPTGHVMTQKTSYLLCVPWAVLTPPHHLGGVARKAQMPFCLWVPDEVSLCVRSSTQPAPGRGGFSSPHPPCVEGDLEPSLGRLLHFGIVFLDKGVGLWYNVYIEGGGYVVASVVSSRDSCR